MWTFAQISNGTKFSRVMTRHYTDHPESAPLCSCNPQRAKCVYDGYFLWNFKMGPRPMSIHNSPSHAVWSGMALLGEFIGIHSHFIRLLTQSLVLFVLVTWILIISVFREYFHFIAITEPVKCKLPKLILNVEPVSDKNTYHHNMNVSYTCKGESKQKNSICINGRWDPKITCTGKLSFITFSK